MITSQTKPTDYLAYVDGFVPQDLEEETEEKLTLESYVNIVKETLQNWVRDHYNAEAWAKTLIINDDIFETLSFYGLEAEFIVANNYYEFDWLETIVEKQIEEEVWCRCNTCSCIYHEADSYTCYVCDEENLEYSFNTCTLDELDDVLYHVRELVTGMDADDMSNIFSYNHVFKSLTDIGFVRYSDGVHQYTDTIKDDIEDYLEKLSTSETNEEILRLTLWATRVMHVNGNIMSDYCDEIEFNIIDSIRNNGLEAFFSREELTEFIESDRIDI